MAQRPAKIAQGNGAPSQSGRMDTRDWTLLGTRGLAKRQRGRDPDQMAGGERGMGVSKGNLGREGGREKKKNTKERPKLTMPLKSLTSHPVHVPRSAIPAGVFYYLPPPIITVRGVPSLADSSSSFIFYFPPHRSRITSRWTASRSSVDERINSLAQVSGTSRINTSTSTASHVYTPAILVSASGAVSVFSPSPAWHYHWPDLTLPHLGSRVTLFRLGILFTCTAGFAPVCIVHRTCVPSSGKTREEEKVRRGGKRASAHTRRWA